MVLLPQNVFIFLYCSFIVWLGPTLQGEEFLKPVQWMMMTQKMLFISTIKYAVMCLQVLNDAKNILYVILHTNKWAVLLCFSICFNCSVFLMFLQRPQICWEFLFPIKWNLHTTHLLLWTSFTDDDKNLCWSSGLICYEEIMTSFMRCWYQSMKT